ncbi:mRNA 3'-end-processing protein rna14 [Dimargaris cristalligena]|nr:mRNA 3'-end-processing protein rna14 [Dimargaris cristalligena]
MSKTQTYEAQISKDKYNAGAWSALLKVTMDTGTEDEVRAVFDRFLAIYPSSGAHWKMYAEYEFKREHREHVVNIFNRCLTTVLSVDLYQFYLDYIFAMNTVSSGLVISTEAQDTIVQALEFVLNRVGIDKDAGPIWTKYIEFLKSREPRSQMDEQWKIDNLRKTFQRAIVIPTNHLEQIWKEYDMFENNLNRFTAKKFLSEKSPAYMTARTAYREMRGIFDSMENYRPPFNLPAPPKWSNKENNYLKGWRKYIEWEHGNPLRLETPELNQRVNVAYKQALAALRFYPEIWVEAAQQFVKTDNPQKAVELLKEAVDVLPHSSLVHFVYAEQLEVQKNIPEMRTVYTNLVGALTTQLDNLSARKEKALATIKERITALTNESAVPAENNLSVNIHSSEEVMAEGSVPSADRSAKRPRVSSPGPQDAISDVDSVLSDTDMDVSEPSRASGGRRDGGAPDLGASANTRSTEADLEADLLNSRSASGAVDVAAQKRAVARLIDQRSKLIEARFKSRMGPLQRELTLAVTIYTRAVRRSEGTVPFRRLFTRLRKIPYVTYHLLVSTALIEYYFEKDMTMAGNVFEVGLKHFGSESDFIIQYLDHLIRINDNVNAQALFERAVSNLPVDQAKDIWDMYLNYQVNYGDIQATLSLETRYLAAYPEETLRNRLMERFSFLDLDTVAERDFGVDDHATSLHQSQVEPSQPRWKDATPSGTGGSGGGAGSADKGVSGSSGPPNDVPHPVIPTKYDTNAGGYGGAQAPGGFAPRAVQRRQILQSVQPDRFPRPDLNQWVPFRASDVVVPPKDDVDESDREADPGVRHRADSGVDGGSARKGAPALEVLESRDLLCDFLSHLPPGPIFQGPRFPIDLIINCIRDLELPQPDPHHSTLLVPPTDSYHTGYQPQPHSYFHSRQPPPSYGHGDYDGEYDPSYEYSTAGGGGGEGAGGHPGYDGYAEPPSTAHRSNWSNEYSGEDHENYQDHGPRRGAGHWAGGRGRGRRFQGPPGYRGRGGPKRKFTGY